MPEKKLRHCIIRPHLGVTIDASPQLQRNTALPFREHSMYKHIFASSTGHSSVLDAQRTVDITGPAMMLVCFAENLLIHDQGMDILFFFSRVRDLCSLFLNCCKLGPFFDLPGMKLLLYFIICGLAFSKKEASWSRLGKEKRRVVMLDLSSIWKTLH